MSVMLHYIGRKINANSETQNEIDRRSKNYVVSIEVHCVQINEIYCIQNC
jgi:hypothetical protein